MTEFTAVIEGAGGGGHVVVVPENAAAEIGGKHLLRVKGTIAGAAYRSNLTKASGILYLGVHKATLAAAGKDIEPDADQR
jgi:hypothetical protein